MGIKLQLLTDSVLLNFLQTFSYFEQAEEISLVQSLKFKLGIPAGYRRAGAPPALKKKFAPARRRRAVRDKK